jgi:hypothetical protein
MRWFACAGRVLGHRRRSSRWWCRRVYFNEQYKSTSAHAFGKVVPFAKCLTWVNVIGLGVVGVFGLPKVTKSHYLLTINYLEEFTLDDNASKFREFRRADAQ